MPDSLCVIIDDVDASLDQSAHLAREVIEPSARAIASAVRDFARRRNWIVVSHAAYVDWAHELLGRDDCPWVVLDPLFPSREKAHRLTALRFTRHYGVQERLTGDGGIEASLVGKRVGVIDDAVSTGRTLRHAGRALQSAGSHIDRVAVCCSSRSAADHFRHLRWSQFLHGDSRVIHMRDGCPFLPFSGRPLQRLDVDRIPGRAIEVLAPSTEVLGNLWQVLWLDANIRKAITQAWADVASAVAVAVGQPARVRDLKVLGDNIPATSRSTEPVHADTLLQCLSGS